MRNQSGPRPAPSGTIIATQSPRRAPCHFPSPSSASSPPSRSWPRATGSPPPRSSWSCPPCARPRFARTPRPSRRHTRASPAIPWSPIHGTGCSRPTRRAPPTRRCGRSCRGTPTPRSPSSLRREWLKVLGAAGAWETFRAEHPRLVADDARDRLPTPSRSGLRGAIPRSRAEARVAFLAARETPAACEPVFAALVARGAISEGDTWTRMRKLLAANQLRGGAPHRPVAAEAPAPEREAARARRRRPRRLPRAPASRKSSRAACASSPVYAIGRLARSRPDEAAERVARLGDGSDERYAWGQIAWQAAMSHHPRALEWYAHAGDGGSPMPRSRGRRAPRCAPATGRKCSPRSASSRPRWRGSRRGATGARARCAPSARPRRATRCCGASRASGTSTASSPPRKSARSGCPTGTAGSRSRRTSIASWRCRRCSALSRSTASATTARRCASGPGRSAAWKTATCSPPPSSRALAGVPDRAINTANRTVQLHDFSQRFPTPAPRSRLARRRSNGAWTRR